MLFILNGLGKRQDLTPSSTQTTLIHTKNGLKSVEDICIGDWVLSYPDNQTPPDRIRQADEYVFHQITHKSVFKEQPLSKFVVSNLATGKRETLLVSANQRIFSKGRGWIAVSDFRAGHVVENFIFGNLLVFRVFHAVETGSVYNIQLGEFQAYYAGEQGVWVHA